MGVSTDGILVYGIPMEEEFNFMGELYTDEYIDHLLGVEECEWDVRRDARNACPVEIVSHCSYDYPMYIVALTGTRIWASRGYPVEVDPEKLNIDPEKIKEYHKFITDKGIPVPEGETPHWVLCSMWG